MHCFNKDIGYFGEAIASKYLQNSSYIIIEKNFRCKIGEIDIIAKDNDYICFIEVKSRYSTCYGSPCEAVNYYKQKKLYKTAQMYIIKNHLFNKFNFRFDVVEVVFNKNTNKPSIKLIKNAFQLDYL
ncbi:YraN family protein [Clostridium niameyense]|uniref:UPF0102 protein FDF74_02440 n=1 Tax=Clostridium niameyense TaxID=1622073 RepID=A0A6M0R912_9CLOT|nr:YraN family protein [Clostridium niameyense]NEZ46069.1 YraN family protein [Clostridium niameyense]